MNLTRRDLLATSAALGALAALPRAQQGAAPEGTRVLVLGGTGFLGPHVVNACKARGWKLSVFNRGKTAPDMFKDDPDVETLLGDRDGDLKSLADAVAAGRRWEAVVDDTGYVPRIVKDSATLLGPAVKRYIFISTVSVYADTTTEGQDESGPLATIEDETNEEVMKNYGALKALCEKAAEAACPGRTANLRPGLIVGPGDRSDRYTYWPVRLARGGEVLAPGSGDDPVQYIDVRDLAEFVARCVADSTIGTYTVNGPAKRQVMRELVGACAAAAAELVPDRPKTTLTWVPTEFLAEQQVAPWGDLPVWIPFDEENKGFHTMKVDKAIAKGLAFRSALDTARDTLSWWNAQPEDRRAKLKAGMTAEREAEVLAAWHAKEGGEKKPG
jgi:2'-hydroxyisoflavone reductase